MDSLYIGGSSLMGRKKPNLAKYAAQFVTTKANKLKKLEAIVAKLPQDKSAVNSLEFWKTHDRRNKH